MIINTQCKDKAISILKVTYTRYQKEVFKVLTANIKKVMSTNKITAKELSKMIDVTPTHISYILNNKRDPSVKLLDKMVIALGVSIDELLRNENISLKNNPNTEKQKQINTVVAHLENKILDPKRLNILNEFIDLVFND